MSSPGRAPGAAVTGAPSDPFDILGLEPRFDLDPVEIGRRQLDLSKALHPDRFASAPAAERRMALGRTIEVNQAARALKDPVKRAEALARRRGLPVGETSEPRPSAALLMEMMEGREQLSEAAAAGDRARVEKLGASMRAREATVTVALAQAFAGEGARDAVLALLGELRYVRRFLDEVSAFEETFL